MEEREVREIISKLRATGIERTDKAGRLLNLLAILEEGNRIEVTDYSTFNLEDDLVSNGVLSDLLNDNDLSVINATIKQRMKHRLVCLTEEAKELLGDGK